MCASYVVAQLLFCLRRQYLFSLHLQFSLFLTFFHLSPKLSHQTLSLSLCSSLFCSSLFCSSLFCSSLFCSSLFCSSLFCSSFFLFLCQILSFSHTFPLSLSILTLPLSLSPHTLSPLHLFSLSLWFSLHFYFSLPLLLACYFVLLFICLSLSPPHLFSHPLSLRFFFDLILFFFRSIFLCFRSDFYPRTLSRQMPHDECAFDFKSIFFFYSSNSSFFPYIHSSSLSFLTQ
jgi:hypothetical protein